MLRYTAVRALAIGCALLGTLAASSVEAQRVPGPLSLYSRSDANAPHDPNGFLLNPTWRNAGSAPPNIEDHCRFRSAVNHLEERSLVITSGRPCLSDVEEEIITLSEPPALLGLGLMCATNSQIGTIRGHVNWFPVTITGRLRNAKYERGGASDQDVQLDVEVKAPNALTTGNRGRAGYHTEFYARETLERLPPFGSSWWHALWAALEDKDRRRELTDNRYAILSGLYGLDGVHQFQAELHPVFAMAVLIDRSAEQGGREEWAIMVRNLGNEGNCATGRLPMTTAPATERNQHYALDLGWRLGATSASVTLGPSWSTNPDLRPRVRPDGANGQLLIDFLHPRPQPGEDDFLFLGTLNIEWRGPIAEGQGFRFLAEGESPIALGRAPEALMQEPRARARAAPVGVAGGDAVNAASEWRTLEPVAGGALEPIVDWQPASEVRASSNYGWVPKKPIATYCDGGGSRDPICLSGWRFALAGAISVHGVSGDGFQRPIPAVALHLAPHGSRALKETPLVGDVLSALGYRLEGRFFERFPMNNPPAGGDLEARGSSVTFHVLPLGGNLRMTPFIFTPYWTPSVGMAFISYDDAAGATTFEPRLRLGYGAGLHIQVWFTESFAEVNRYTAGGLRAQNVFMFGLLLAHVTPQI